MGFDGLRVDIGVFGVDEVELVDDDVVFIIVSGNFLDVGICRPGIRDYCCAGGNMHHNFSFESLTSSVRYFYHETFGSICSTFDPPEKPLSSKKKIGGVT